MKALLVLGFALVVFGVNASPLFFASHSIKDEKDMPGKLVKCSKCGGLYNKDTFHNCPK